MPNKSYTLGKVLIIDDEAVDYFCSCTSVHAKTGYPAIETAVESIKLGALDYLVKPFSVKKLESTVIKALSNIPEHKDENGLRIDASKIIIGKSHSTATDSTVLITGESETGKELVARAIHAYSNRKDKEFVAVDCSAVPFSLMKSAISLNIQAKLLRVIQEREFMKVGDNKKIKVDKTEKELTERL